MNMNQTNQQLTSPDRETQADIIEEALKRKGMSAWQLSKELELKSSSFIYNILANRTHMAKPETVQRLSEVLGIDPDRMYIAAERIPPDVHQTILDHPKLVHVVRNLRAKLEG